MVSFLLQMDAVTVGDGTEVDSKIVFDGHAKDFYIALDDSADKLHYWRRLYRRNK